MIPVLVTTERWYTCEYKGDIYSIRKIYYHTEEKTSWQVWCNHEDEVTKEVENILINLVKDSHEIGNKE